VRRTSAAGALVVSGFLDERADTVVGATAPFVVVERRSRDGWSAMRLVPSPPAH
jgi:ribosomal protein L11 methylase PrmA